jgi:hypothetical protein
VKKEEEMLSSSFPPVVRPNDWIDIITLDK